MVRLPVDLTSSRIVEIGPKPFFFTCFPQQTTYFSTFAREPSMSMRALPRLWSALHDPKLALIVCHPPASSPWQWEWLVRAVFNRRIVHAGFPLAQALAPQLLRRPLSAPIVVLDTEDLPVINRNNFFLLDRCRLYFKRELPVDHWRLFLKTAHPNLPTGRFRRLKQFHTWLEKIRPISIGLPLAHYRELPVDVETKSVDVFFSGRVSDVSTVRLRGLPELLALRDRGLAIDIPNERLPPSEFYRRCARAWLVWSPEGFGWDCFRHYEALACNAVPVINHPTIDRYQPLLAGEHAIYYDVEAGGLTRAIMTALSNKAALSKIARAGRDHVLAHHTPPAIANHILKLTLDFSPAAPDFELPHPVT